MKTTIVILIPGTVPVCSKFFEWIDKRINQLMNEQINMAVYD